MYFQQLLLLVLLSAKNGLSFWDDGTTTPVYYWWEMSNVDWPRVSFYRWLHPRHAGLLSYVTPRLDLNTQTMAGVAGISYGMHAVTVAMILNARTLITAANALEAYKYRQQDLRIWAPGINHRWFTPYRYRVWRFRRILPRSANPEHMLGPRGTYSFRHDIVVMHCWEQILIIAKSSYYFIAMRVPLTGKKQTFDTDRIILVGSGFVTPEHVRGNYRMYFVSLNRIHIQNCEKYLPKWWGKFICFANTIPVYGVQSGSGVFINGVLIALGAFEIRYNEERVMVFTDLRYYVDYIEVYANITPGEYYDYAYQYWGTYEKQPYYWRWWQWNWNNRVNYYRPGNRKIYYGFTPLGRK